MSDRRLDIKIAEKVFGHKVRVKHNYTTNTTYYYFTEGHVSTGLPYYSTDIQDTMQIIDKLQEFDCSVIIEAKHGDFYIEAAKVEHSMDKHSFTEEEVIDINLARGICNLALQIIERL